MARPKRLSSSKSASASRMERPCARSRLTNTWRRPGGYTRLGADDAFAKQYARGREPQLVRREDEILEIADDATNDFVSRKRGDEDVEAVDYDHIARSKLRIDTRKWLIAKRLQKKYGDRVATEVSGPDGGPVEVKQMTDDERAKAMAFLLAKAQRSERAEARSNRGPA